MKHLKPIKVQGFVITDKGSKSNHIQFNHIIYKNLGYRLVCYNQS